MQKSNTPFPSFSHVLCVRALGYQRVVSPTLEAGVVCLVRAVFENLYPKSLNSTVVPLFTQLFLSREL